MPVQKISENAGLSSEFSLTLEQTRPFFSDVAATFTCQQTLSGLVCCTYWHISELDRLSKDRQVACY